MLGERVECQGLSVEAKLRFDQELALPETVNWPRSSKAGTAAPLIVTILLSPATWAALAGIGTGVVLWIGKRIAVPIDEFFKAIASEAGKDTYQWIKSLVCDLEREVPESRAFSDRICQAKVAAEEVDGAKVSVNLGILIGGEEKSVQLIRNADLDDLEENLAFMAMTEAISSAATRVFASGSVMFSRMNVHVTSYGFKLTWLQEPSMMRKWQGFRADGEAYAEPMDVPDETKEEIEMLRARLLMEFDPETREAAQRSLKKRDEEKQIASD